MDENDLKNELEIRRVMIQLMSERLTTDYHSQDFVQKYYRHQAKNMIEQSKRRDGKPNITIVPFRLILPCNPFVDTITMDINNINDQELYERCVKGSFDKKLLKLELGPSFIKEYGGNLNESYD